MDVIIRVELRGNPGAETYKALHAFMEDERFWESAINGEPEAIALPHAMYAGETNTALPELAKSLQGVIMRTIWPQGAIVLVIEWKDWAQAGASTADRK